MDAKNLPLNTILKERQQWVVPVYQRQYAWESGDGQQIDTFWSNIFDGAEKFQDTQKVLPHFFGAMIYEPAKGQGFGTIPIQYVVDGQQRLTTFHIFLAALYHKAAALENEPIKNALSEYLFNPKSDAMTNPERDVHKLWPSAPDRPYYLSLIKGGWDQLWEDFPEFFKKDGWLYKTKPIPKMIAAFCKLAEFIDEYFEEFAEVEDNLKFNNILKTFLEGFIIVVIKLGDNDDPRAIFASLNGNAKPLSSFDLIRNDIFQRAIGNGENEDKLYAGNWSSLESPFWQEIVKQGRYKRARTDHFITHFLVAHSAEDLTHAEVVHEYRLFSEMSEFQNVETEIDELIAYSKIYERLEQSDHNFPEKNVAEFFKAWDISVFHPLILTVGRSELPNEEKHKIYSRIEDYVVRRDLAGLTRKNMNKNVVSILKKMKTDGVSGQVLEDYFVLSKGDGSKMPTDEDVKKSIVETDLYSLRAPKLRYIFKSIELAMRDAKQENISFVTDNLQIEHVLPTKWAKHWPLANGLQATSELWTEHQSSSQEVVLKEQIERFENRQNLKNTLGNLTLLTEALNPSVSNGGWDLKKGHKGLAKSLLMLNKEIVDVSQWIETFGLSGAYTTWGEDVIIARSLKLSERVNSIWLS